MTDMDHWGVVDRWNYPDDGYGDCEDYVLLKRRLLIQLGWPREALLVTVVLDNEDEGHAVLTVTTDKGDYVLDNKEERKYCSGQRPATVSSSGNRSPTPTYGFPSLTASRHCLDTWDRAFRKFATAHSRLRVSFRPG